MPNDTYKLNERSVVIEALTNFLIEATKQLKKSQTRSTEQHVDHDVFEKILNTLQSDNPIPEKTKKAIQDSINNRLFNTQQNRAITPYLSNHDITPVAALRRSTTSSSSPPAQQSAQDLSALLSVSFPEAPQTPPAQQSAPASTGQGDRPNVIFPPAPSSPPPSGTKPPAPPASKEPELAPTEQKVTNFNIPPAPSNPPPSGKKPPAPPASKKPALAPTEQGVTSSSAQQSAPSSPPPPSGTKPPLVSDIKQDVFATWLKSAIIATEEDNHQPLLEIIKQKKLAFNIFNNLLTIDDQNYNDNSIEFYKSMKKYFQALETAIEKPDLFTQAIAKTENGNSDYLSALFQELKSADEIIRENSKNPESKAVLVDKFIEKFNNLAKAPFKLSDKLLNAIVEFAEANELQEKMKDAIKTIKSVITMRENKVVSAEQNQQTNSSVSLNFPPPPPEENEVVSAEQNQQTNSSVSINFPPPPPEENEAALINEEVQQTNSSIRLNFPPPPQTPPQNFGQSEEKNQVANSAEDSAISVNDKTEAQKALDFLMKASSDNPDLFEKANTVYNGQDQYAFYINLNEKSGKIYEIYGDQIFTRNYDINEAQERIVETQDANYFQNCVELESYLNHDINIAKANQRNMTQSDSPSSSVAPNVTRSQPVQTKDSNQRGQGQSEV